MKLKNIFLYSLDFFLLNNYLEVIIQSIESEIFDIKI